MRYLIGAIAALMLAAGGVLMWKGTARDALAALPAAPPATAAADTGDDTVADPPAATEKTREQRRFARYDRDRDGAVARDEYLAARRKAFAKLDTDGNGTLSFDEYAAKAEAKFAAADADKSRSLDPAEFATTRVVRKAKPRCPPAREPRGEGDADG